MRRFRARKTSRLPHRPRRRQRSQSPAERCESRPASIQLASQLPDLIENLATATERLNEAIDRAERYLALADPMIRTMDAVLPQLEALVATGNDVYNAVSSIPGVSTIVDSPVAVPRLRQGKNHRTTSIRAEENLTHSPAIALSPNIIRHCDDIAGRWSQSRGRSRHVAFA